MRVLLLAKGDWHIAKILQHWLLQVPHLDRAMVLYVRLYVSVHVCVHDAASLYVGLD